jgi:hypothetical protein
VLRRGSSNAAATIRAQMSPLGPCGKFFPFYYYYSTYFYLHDSRIYLRLLPPMWHSMTANRACTTSTNGSPHCHINRVRRDGQGLETRLDPQEWFFITTCWRPIHHAMPRDQRDQHQWQPPRQSRPTLPRIYGLSNIELLFGRKFFFSLSFIY